MSPEPIRPLGRFGRALWDEVHGWGDVAGSLEPLLMLCERVDERTRLRVAMSRSDASGQPIDATPEQHAALRALEAQIETSFRDLGIRSILPNRSDVSDADNWAAELAALRG
jgi:hypothetical protein